MKKWLWLLAAVLLLAIGTALAEENADWMEAPVITSAYEISSGQVYLEWTGHAPVYQVVVDGRVQTSAAQSNAVVSLSQGTHSIQIYPAMGTKNADTNLDLDISIAGYGGTLNVDLAALGLNPKEVTVGYPSQALSLDYISDPIYASMPEKSSASTDEQDRVLLTFADRLYSDEYTVSIRIGQSANHVRFVNGNEACASLIHRAGNMVTLTMDPVWLTSQNCMVPELDEKCTFTVQLRRYSIDYVSGDKVQTVIHESKISTPFEYTPRAAWKTAPEINYASQTAEGEITLRWVHEAYGRNCEYAVMKVNKTFGIKTGEERVAVVTGDSAVLPDLMNGSYCFTVVPQFGSEKGDVSAEVNVDVANEWVAAPALTCTDDGNHGVILSWPSASNVDTWHFKVLAGDNGSVLRYVGLDYSVRGEWDVQAVPGEMTYLYSAGDEIPEEGLRLRFELYGIRHTQNGAEQRTGVTTQNITLVQP